MSDLTKSARHNYVKQVWDLPCDGETPVEHGMLCIKNRKIVRLVRSFRKRDPEFVCTTNEDAENYDEL